MFVVTLLRWSRLFSQTPLTSRSLKCQAVVRITAPSTMATAIVMAAAIKLDIKKIYNMDLPKNLGSLQITEEVAR